jgi:hypothetical protein
VRKIINADSQAERDEILIGHREAILDDVDQALGESAVEPTAAQQDARNQAVEAVSAARAGFDRAAQTLLASALTHLLEGGLGFQRLWQGRDKFGERDLNDAAISELRVACLEMSTVNALTQTNRSPEGFNRHGTQHGMPAYLTEPAMLGAALLVAGWLRELSWLAEHRPEAVKDDPPTA